MASSINASTAGAGGVITTADNSGVLNLQSSGTTVATVQSTGFSLPTTSTINAANTFGFKNRIINGGMIIDQRNAGAATANTISGYTLDRWTVYQSTTGKLIAQQNAGSVTPATGFSNYLGITSQSAYSIAATDQYLIFQKIEGFNTADLGWGTANAKTITVSAWVYSSLTGTFGGSLQNSAQTYCYPFSYSISTANTWTQISVTVAGPTAGTWIGATNGTGLNLNFSLGTGATYSGTAGAWVSASFITSATGATSVVGTNGATFYITGVQLEVGSQATSFDFRSQGTELALCQRYFEISYTTGVKPGTVTNVGLSQGQSVPIGYPTFGGFPVQVCFMVTKRTTPTMVTYSNNSGASGNVYTTNPAADSATTPFVYTSANGYSGYSGANIVNAGGFIQWQWTASAEL